MLLKVIFIVLLISTFDSFSFDLEIICCGAQGFISVITKALHWNIARDNSI